MTDTDFFDDLETRSRDEREAAQFKTLGDQIDHARSRTGYYGRVLAGVNGAEVKDRAALAKLPVTRKSDLKTVQTENPPFGGMVAGDFGTIGRVFASPGPIYEPEGREPDYWRTARALHAAGFRRGDLVHNTFSYHLTPGGFIMDAGCRALGCAVIPAGVGQTEQQVETIAALRPTGYAGTPSFLRIILDRAAELGVDCTSFKKALVSGEALPPSLRAQFAEQGIEMQQAYATADLGLIAYESPAREGLIVDEGVIVEIVRPGTGDPVAEGEVGEVVVTSFCSDYPLIRFATGDLSAVMEGESPCGRTGQRLKGWMGRADQTTKVKGMFVHPSQIAEVVKRHDVLAKARLVVENPDNKDRMTLHCEVRGNGDDALADAIRASVQSVCKVRGDVTFAAPGSLANDGKVIDDLRTYE